MNGLRNNLATIVVGACVVAAIAVATALLGPWHASTTAHASGTALVHDGEGITHEMPLDEDATLRVQTSLGTNTVVVKDGAAYMLEADCPRQSCLHQAPISHPGEQIVCLPHRLWVEVVDGGGADADVSHLDEDAVTWEDDEADVDLVSR